MSQTVTSTTSVPTGSQTLTGTATTAAAATAGGGAGGTGAGSTALLSNPPPALSALSAGQVIRAVSAGPAADGATIVETRFGKFALQLNGAPAKGTVLQFEITKSGNPTELTLIQNGKAKGAATSVGASPSRAPTVTVRAIPVDGAARAAPPFQAQIVNTSGAGASGPGVAGLVTGKILSSPPGGPTLIQTSTGQLSVAGFGNGTPGTELTLRPILPATTGAPRGITPAQAPSLTSFGSAWTALEDVHAILTAHDIRTGPPTLPSAIPATGPQLATGLTFFLSALFHGSLQEWLGRDAMRVLETGDNKDLLRRLGEDFRQMARPVGEPVSGEWRMVMLPLLDDRTLHQIRFYFREDEDADAETESPPGTRFVVETNLSRLGALQLDGLVRPARFDLMVRTHAPWPAQIQADISTLFTAANQEFSAQGQIEFQVQNPFAIRPDLSEAENASGVYA